MGYIDRPVDWLQYALKIRTYTSFQYKAGAYSAGTSTDTGTGASTGTYVLENP